MSGSQPELIRIIRELGFFALPHPHKILIWSGMDPECPFLKFQVIQM